MSIAVIEVSVGGMVVSVTETQPITNIEVSMPGTQGPKGDTGDTGPAGPTGATGAAGADGRTILYGAVNPTTEGANGDFYINTASHALFGPKAAGVWPAGTSLIGPTGATGSAGADGNTILYGTGAPSNALGVDGNFYIATDTSTLYGPKASGIWPAGTSLVGPAGAPGSGNNIAVLDDGVSITSQAISFDFVGGGVTATQTGGAVTVTIPANPTNTDALAEGSTNLYFTAARVHATVLTGLSTAAATIVTATHTVLEAIGFLQKQVSDNLTTLTTHTANTSNPHSVTKTQVGLGNVDNTSDANKPVSTATQTALDAKQATLVSGTNIKTVNSNSLLGLGDVAIAETTTTIGTLINGATDKATPVDADYVGLMDSAALNVLKKLSWANIKATLKTYFDSVATTLTNKTLALPTLTGYTETVYTLAGTVIDPANGTVQTKTLLGNTTFTESIADGQSVVLMLNPATYTTTWPTITWINSAGSGAAPTLEASSMNVIVLWQVGGTLYGNWIGSA